MKKIDRILLVACAVLLAAAVALLGYNTYTNHQRRLTDEQIAELKEVLWDQRMLAQEILDNYSDAAYDNPDVDRIAEQQLLATETQHYLLQLLSQRVLDLTEIVIELY